MSPEDEIRALYLWVNVPSQITKWFTPTRFVRSLIVGGDATKAYQLLEGLIESNVKGTADEGMAIEAYAAVVALRILNHPCPAGTYEHLRWAKAIKEGA